MYYYFTAKIYDSLRSPGKPIYLSTKTGVTIDGVKALDILEIPDSIEKGIEPSETTATASQIKFRVNNPNTEFSKLLYERINSDGTMFWNEKVEIWGHKKNGVNKIFSGLISEISSDPMETYYDISTSDVLKVLKTDIFTRELSEYQETFGAPVETIDQVNANRMPSGFVCGEETDAQGEKLRYITFDGHPLDCFLGMMKVVFSIPTNKIGAGYLDLTYLDFIDMDSINDLRVLLPDSVYGDFHFKFYESIESPFTFFKEQIFKACVIFPYITNDGKMGLKLHAQPTSSAGVQTFDEDSIIKITSKTNSMSKYVNHIRVDFNNIKNFDEDKFNRTFYAIQSEALEKTRFLSPRDEPLTFQLEGINFNFTEPSRQITIVQQLVDSYFSRYSSSVTNVTLDTDISFAETIKVGDYVKLSHNSLIDWGDEYGGTRGLNRGENTDPVDPNAKLNVGDDWSGFVQNNKIGIDVEGYEFLKTTSEEIRKEFFVGSSKSCLTNHNEFNNWINKQ